MSEKGNLVLDHDDYMSIVQGSMTGYCSKLYYLRKYVEEMDDLLKKSIFNPELQGNGVAFLNMEDVNDIEYYWDSIRGKIRENERYFKEEVKEGFKKHYRDQNPIGEFASRKVIYKQKLYDSVLETKVKLAAEKFGINIEKNQTFVNLGKFNGEDLLYIPDYLIGQVRLAWNDKVVKLILEVKGDLNDEIRKNDIEKMSRFSRKYVDSNPDRIFFCLGNFPKKGTKFDTYLEQAEKERVKNKNQIFTINADEKAPVVSIAFDEKYGFCLYNDPKQITDKQKEITESVFNYVQDYVFEETYLNFKK